MVDDGVCDCCDGTDELGQTTGSSICSDTCAREAAEARESAARRIATLEEGARLKKAYVAKGVAGVAQHQRDIEELTARLHELENQTDALEATKTAQEAEEAEGRQRTLEETDMTILARLGIDNFSIESLRSLLIRYARRVDHHGKEIMRMLREEREEETTSTTRSEGVGEDEEGEEDMMYDHDHDGFYGDDYHYGDHGMDEYGEDYHAGSDEYGDGEYHEYQDLSYGDGEDGFADGFEDDVNHLEDYGASDYSDGAFDSEEPPPLPMPEAIEEQDRETEYVLSADEYVDQVLGDEVGLAAAEATSFGEDEHTVVEEDAALPVGREGGGAEEDLGGRRLPFSAEEGGTEDNGEEATTATGEQEEQEQDQEDFLADPVANQAPFQHPELEATREKLREARGKIRELKRDLDEAKDEAGMDFGEDLEFWPLLSKCFELKHQQYTYEMCPFKEAKQKDGRDSTSLGTWKGIVGAEEDESGGESNSHHSLLGVPGKVFKFEDGAYCWNGPERSTTVQLQCATRDEVVAVDEPSTCMYTMVFGTPSACNVEHTEGLQLDLENNSLMDLEGGEGAAGDDPHSDL